MININAIHKVWVTQTGRTELCFQNFAPPVAQMENETASEHRFKPIIHN